MPYTEIVENIREGTDLGGVCQEINNSPLDMFGMCVSQVVMSSTLYLKHVCLDGHMLGGHILGAAGINSRIVNLWKVLKAVGLGEIT